MSNIEQVFYENFKKEIFSYVFYTDLLDFYLENTDFNMLEVRSWIKNNLDILDGKIVDIVCVSDPSINNSFEDYMSDIDSS